MAIRDVFIPRPEHYDTATHKIKREIVRSGRSTHDFLDSRNVAHLYVRHPLVSVASLLASNGERTSMSEDDRTDFALMGFALGTMYIGYLYTPRGRERVNQATSLLRIAAKGLVANIKKIQPDDEISLPLLAAGGADGVHFGLAQIGTVAREAITDWSLEVTDMPYQSQYFEASTLLLMNAAHYIATREDMENELRRLDEVGAPDTWARLLEDPDTQ